MTPSDDRRLHPFSLLFSLVTGAWRYVLPALFVLFAARRGAWELWFTFLIIPYAAASILRYLTYRYRFAEDELVIRSGMIFHNERHIPYARIHNIGTVRNILHRMLGVADVRIETAGGQEPEARIQVLGMEAVDEMRRRVFERKRETAEAPAPGETTLLHMNPWDLALLGLVDNRGGVVIGAAIGLVWEMSWQFGLFERTGFSPSDLIRAFFSRSLDRLPPGALALATVGAVLGFIVLLRFFSVGWALINLHGFRLALAGSDLSTVRGLFTRVTASIPLHRIQVVVVREKPLHRYLGCVEVKVETAGGGPEQEKQAGKEWLAPLLPKERLASLLAIVQPGLSLESLAWEPVDPRAGRRILKRELIVAALVPLAFAYFLRWWAILLFAVMALLGLLQARYQPGRMGYAATDAFVAWRSGWLWRKLSIARVAKIQAVTLAASPFDRRYEMASVRVDTAGAGASAHRIRIPFLDAQVARGLAASLATRAQASEFRW